MRRNSRMTAVTRPLLILAAIWVAGVSPAYAYLDPGTGSLMLQMLIGGLSAGAAILAGFWSRIRSTLRGLRTGAGRSPATPDNAQRPEDDYGA
jgi:hypothetical protein